MSNKLLFKDIDEPGLASIDVYKRRGGYAMAEQALAMARESIVTSLKDSGLRGRGGAGFPTGLKASFIPQGKMDKYLVCNADESEPGTFKDRELIQKNPHSLIEGMIIAAYAVGANKAFIFIRGEYVQQADILERAIEEAKAAGYLGPNVLGRGVELDMWVHRGAGAYICGEETGLLDALEGRRGNPRLKPPFPANQGLYQGPTLINNVETLTAIKYILEVGAEAYAAMGVEKSSGTKLISVSGNVKRPGNYEIEMGMTGRDIIYGLAGGIEDDREVLLWFPGGSSSPVLTKDDLDLPYDYESMAGAGTMLGSGAIIVADDSNSVVDIAVKTASFYKHESCGKCTPCREGTNWTTKMLKRIQSGDATPMDLDVIESVCSQIMGNCLCVLGDAMAMPVSSMVKKFRPEFETHIEAARAAREAALLAELSADGPGRDVLHGIAAD
ncbi:NADH-quinone oxidoreductase subunit NuoF [Patulibacter brassicae]|jgi:NADH-quinone oxidoreductase subunit F|uniref:NADH-quinone oxidoreductase subunit F n=1 Tax=Patulibacter brassicae TaxID=1705717 RepID=A0ABU4VI23_9ACTN|nr:NADH-quinone oxidoreductase subunit NuoF [Patulibacter brassicae]MDX8151022.1 NADH-quinone oxidoreductase subunit NuoF [Patulibacter brassicae]